MENIKKVTKTDEKRGTKNETKEKIKEVALNLFSKRGYQAISIRDICKEVGIKESTVYYHFKNKQDILDMILQQIDDLINMMETSFDVALVGIKEVKEQDFCLVAVNYVRQYLLQPNVHKMICMLTIERLVDQKADNLYRRLLFDLPLNHQEAIFHRMYDRGLIKNPDSIGLAYDYNEIIFFAYQRYCFGSNECMDVSPELVKQVTDNMKNLYERMQVVQ